MLFLNILQKEKNSAYLVKPGSPEAELYAIW